MGPKHYWNHWQNNIQSKGVEEGILIEIRIIVLNNPYINLLALSYNYLCWSSSVRTTAEFPVLAGATLLGRTPGN
jgi:hypothetical protein